ncbi:hypothetical protein [Corynebacterium aquatimens]|uniref:Uncharacterized protein n=1 Tax=Corynebacterium aquatimens TaxID=1190508 RepID=A0A931GXN3_9CORY|nr:hypothetical protein [Corynebacterium aquatimens]MBG6122024.1 hypothetical protein [Corynebacterium aquatimens]WJY65435.1 hypothetical protein CAQUA_03610 [Corynebacterium aquatimens]
MAQETFAGPEHYTEFDPKKFLRDLKIQKDMENEAAHESDSTDTANPGTSASE